MGKKRKKFNTPSRHHRLCKSLNGSNDDRNISIVPTKKHQAWHTLFGNMTAEMICKEINKVWIDPDYEILCRKKDE